MSSYITPEGYFNATEIVPEYEDGTKVHKPAHFLDNKKIQSKLQSINKPAKIHRGRGACTFIPNELKSLFIAWIALNTNYEEQ